uniref:Phosphoprotein n=1 Tax=Bovine parainfluenza 3 virus TaxID=3052729 RepID=A0A1Q2SVV2_PI3B|nr:phosphoprotein [Respirovirus bovis]BBM34135.1 phosphoprotein [Respirovirus bovis]
MENNVQNNQIMDFWEEGPGDKSSDISSALDIIEFILSTDSQESTADSNEINTGATRLSTTIYQSEFKATETSKEDSGSANENRQLRASYELAAETKNRNVNQEIIQGRNRRGSSSDSRAEAMVTRGISRSSSDPNNGTQIQENIDHNEVGEMDKNSTQREVRQFKDVSVKVPGGDAISPAEQDGDGDDGRSLESISTFDSGNTSVVTAATLDDEEELLMKNNRPRRHQSTSQEDDKGIKKGVGRQKNSDKQSPILDYELNFKGSKRSQKTPKINTNTGEPARSQSGSQGKRITSWNILNSESNSRAESTNQNSQTSTPGQNHTVGPGRTTPEQRIKTQKTDGKEGKDTEESTRFTERAITLLQNLGVIQSAAKLDLYQDKRVVCVANVLNNADTASKIDFLAGLMIGVSMDHDTKLNQIQNEILSLKTDLKKMDESHRRLIENQKEQLSLITSLISNLKIMTERGGKKDQTELGGRTSMIKTKAKEEKIKKVRFDPLMETQGIERNIPDLYRSTEKTPENDIQIKSEINRLNDESNATRLVPRKTSSTMRSLIIIINNSNLSPKAKQSYINELKLCKSDEEISELMDMFNEDVSTQ